MKIYRHLAHAVLAFSFLLIFCGVQATAQQPASQPAAAAAMSDGAALPDAPGSPAAAVQPTAVGEQGGGEQGQQTKRILGVIPNFRAVSVATTGTPLRIKRMRTSGSSSPCPRCCIRTRATTRWAAELPRTTMAS
jgi:hypothetical protein